MKPTTPAQAEATIATARALLHGDPLDVVSLYRSHLAIVLGALDEARRERDEARASAIRVGEECDAARAEAASAEQRLGWARHNGEQAVRLQERVIRERDEARAALAVAEMARDVAWVRALTASCEDVPDSYVIAAAGAVLGLGRDGAHGVVFDEFYGITKTYADIAAAIRAARGAK